MSEKRTTLAYTLDGVEITLTIVRATARMGVARYLLINKGVEANKNETDEALKTLRLMIYPDCIIATESAEGMEFPPTFEQFVELPEDFINKWTETVYSINPQWLPSIPAVANSPLLPDSKPSKKG